MGSETLSSTYDILSDEFSLRFYSTSNGYKHQLHMLIISKLSAISSFSKILLLPIYVGQLYLFDNTGIINVDQQPLTFWNLFYLW